MKARLNWTLLLTILSAGLVAGGWAYAAPVSDTTTYTLGTCPVTGAKLSAMGEPVVKEIGGREVRFCCPACVGQYEAKEKEFAAKVDQAVIAQEKDSYPLDTCVVSGLKLDSKGTPTDVVYGNRLVRFCCAGCPKTFEKDPAKYIAKLDEAVIAQQKPSYPLDTCVVTGNKLGDKPVDMVIANRLVRLCCPDCEAAVKKDPGKYFAMIDEAAKAKK